MGVTAHQFLTLPNTSKKRIRKTLGELQIGSSHLDPTTRAGQDTYHFLQAQGITMENPNQEKIAKLLQSLC